MQGAKLSKKKPKKVTTKKKNGKQKIEIVPKEQTQNDFGMDYESNKKLADHQKVIFFNIQKIYKSIEQTILDKARGHRERFTLLK